MTINKDTLGIGVLFVAGGFIWKQHNKINQLEGDLIFCRVEWEKSRKALEAKEKENQGLRNALLQSQKEKHELNEIIFKLKAENAFQRMKIEELTKKEELQS